MRTEIPANGRSECECGEFVKFSMLERLVGVHCESCKKYLPLKQFRPQWQALLEIFGVSISLDWDGQLIVESEYEIHDELRKWLFQCQYSIRTDVEFKAKQSQRVYFGGSLDGQKHHGWDPSYLNHISRGRWEVYVKKDRNDPRMIFLCETTSEKKAKLAVFEKESRLS